MHFSALIKIESPPRSNSLLSAENHFMGHESFSLKDTTVIASRFSAITEKEKAEPNFKATNVTVISKSAFCSRQQQQQYRVCECSAAKRKTKPEAAAAAATREDALPEKWQSEKKY